MQIIGFLLQQAVFLSLSLIVVTIKKVINLFKLNQQLETEKQGE